MARNKSNCRPSSYKNGNVSRRGDDLSNALVDITSSNMPGKWVAGLGLGALIVTGMAIKAISELSDKK